MKKLICVFVLAIMALPVFACDVQFYVDDPVIRESLDSPQAQVFVRSIRLGLSSSSAQLVIVDEAPSRGYVMEYVMGVGQLDVSLAYINDAGEKSQIHNMQIDLMPYMTGSANIYSLSRSIRTELRSIQVCQFE